MPVGDRQKLITEIVATVLEQTPQPNAKFEWFINKHTKDYFRELYPLIDDIFRFLKGDLAANQVKRPMGLKCDAYFGGKHNFIFEYDEYQHFSSARLKTLEQYPPDLKLNFSLTDWKNYCRLHKVNADKYRNSKTTIDFNFHGGRTAQRAYLDCFRDLLPQKHGLQPTLRISEFETNGIYTNNQESRSRIEKLLRKKLNL